MAEPRHLGNAPLVEALLDIQVVPGPGVTAESLAGLDRALGPDYARKAEKRTGGFSLKMDSNSPDSESVAKARTVHVGYVYQSSSNKKIVQATVNQFTQNFLKPYSEFEALVTEAQKNWVEYRRICKPTAITRIALRYINDLRLPADGRRFEEYLPYSPAIPENLPQLVSDFAYRVTIDDNTEIKVIINQLFQGVVGKEGVQVILDIDAIIERQRDVDDPALWSSFDRLRDMKNRVFFSFVTEKLLETYR